MEPRRDRATASVSVGAESASGSLLLRSESPTHVDGPCREQQQDRDLRASHQKQQRNRAEKQKERLAQVLDVSFVDSFHVNSELLWKMFRRLFRELFENGLQFGVRGLEGDAGFQLDERAIRKCRIVGELQRDVDIGVVPGKTRRQSRRKWSYRVAPEREAYRGACGHPPELLRQESVALAIDLKNVSVVDRDAVQLLALTEYNGTKLRNCPKYVREWVTRERAEIRGGN